MRETPKANLSTKPDQVHYVEQLDVPLVFVSNGEEMRMSFKVRRRVDHPA